MGEYDWLEKRKLRAVDQLKLWGDNPRLDPEERHVNLADYASDLLAENGEKDSFLKLIGSIASDGFIPADPVVIWKNNENNNYYVAEGNRRVLALKLLRNPEKAPRPLRSYMRKMSGLIERETIEKIKVCIAPSFDACEWYINQRHASSSIQRSWSRHQQQRWIAELYDKNHGDIDKVMSITGLSKSQLESTLRILKIRDFSLKKTVFNKLSVNEQESVKSHRLPMTILERWFDNLIVREKWGIEFDGENVTIQSNMQSFLVAYAKWIKLVLHRDEPDVSIQINTRTITANLDGILAFLPEVSFGDNADDLGSNQNDINGGDANQKNNEKDTTIAPGKEDVPEPEKPLSKNPDRPKLVIDTCQLKTTNYKLDALLKEFKEIPISRYKNCLAASLRVFLDLAISEYIQEESCKNDIKKAYGKNFSDIPLKKRLEYLKANNLKSKKAACKVLEKLLNHTNHYSLDILNTYIHGKDTQYTGQQFLNGFWDFLFPLFIEILDIKES